MFRARLPFITSLAVVTAMLGGPAQAQAQAQPAPDFRATKVAGRQAVRQALRDTGASSISVALLSGRRVVWSQGFGRITPQGARPTATTTYPIGSVSKMVTTLAVMRLVDQGRISLDAPVVRYLPDFRMLSPQYGQITVRMLLNHSAGLPGSDYSNGISYAPIPGYARQVMAALATSRLKTTPGAMNVYCNDCFTLAGEIVARVSGSTYEEYVRQQILTPLGMTHTGFQLSGSSAPVIVDGVELPREYTNITASGGIVSTPRDMLRLAQVFTGARRGIVSQNAVAAMGSDQTTTTLKAGPRSELRYGLGWDDVADPATAAVGATTWVKGGDVGQHHGAFLVDADNDLAVMVSAAGTGIDSSALESIAGTVMLRALVDTGVTPRFPRPVNGVPARSPANPATVNRITGVYLASGANARVTRVNDRAVRLFVYSDGSWVKRPGRYVLRANGAFWSTKQPGTSLYRARAWGRTYLVLRRIGGTGTYYSSFAIGQRMRPVTGLPAWSGRVGQKWLLANENPQSIAWTVPWLRFSAIPGLSGYLTAEGTLVGAVPFAAGEDPDLGSMFLQVPLGLGRDLYDFTISRHGGEEVLQFASSVMRQQATVEPLVAGSVAIGSRGFVEWRRVLTAQTVNLSGQSAWKVYDASLVPVDSGSAAPARVTLTADSYLVLFGAAGTVIAVS